MFLGDEIGGGGADAGIDGKGCHGISWGRRPLKDISKRQWLVRNAGKHDSTAEKGLARGGDSALRKPKNSSLVCSAFFCRRETVRRIAFRNIPDPHYFRLTTSAAQCTSYNDDEGL
jgi:hypothetical protein